MFAPYQGPWPCPTCGQSEPEPIDELQRLGQEFDAARVTVSQPQNEAMMQEVNPDMQPWPYRPSDRLEPTPAGDPGMDACEREHLLGEIARLKAELAEATTQREKDAEIIAAFQTALKPFATIRPSSLYAENGSDFEKYEVVLASVLEGEGWEFTGDDLAVAREALARAKEAGY